MADTKTTSEEGEGKVQISLYHYNDDNRIMVFLDKNGRRNPSTRKKKSKGIAGYVSPKNGNVTREHKVKAQQLASNNHLLKRKLRDNLFLDACYMTGVNPNELQPKSLEDFRTHPNRAQELTREEQKLRFEDFQSDRLELLETVVAEEERAYVTSAKLEEMQAKEMKKLQHEFSQSLRLEQNQVNQMVKGRQKYERVLEVENRRIYKQRQKSEKRYEDMQQKIRKIEAAKAMRIERLKAMGEERESRIKRKVKDQEKIAAAIVKRHHDHILYKAERTAKFEANMAESRAGNKRKEELKAKFREQRRLQAEERLTEQRELLTRRLTAKGVHAEHVKKARIAQRIASKTERNIKINSRARKAARLRNAAENRQKQQIEKMERFYARQQQMEEIKHAIGERRKQVLREEKIRRDRWRSQIALQRDITPGPGEYDLPSTLTETGGTFNMSKPKNEFELAQYRAKDIPAPGDYFNIDTASTLVKSGGSWSKYKPKSDVELSMDRARQMPGPGEYKIVLKPDTVSVSFGDAEPMSEIERVMLNASRSPAPGASQPDNVPKRPKKLKNLQKQFGISNKALKFAARMKGKLANHRKSAASYGEPIDNDNVEQRRPLSSAQ